ncbi:MAG: class I SAM-dependent methyltransferase [candidate division WOR-3 bacterium]|nr:MAG: class I SAM-dependent methyltransferase [candidate division WOR-3 bacterium]
MREALFDRVARFYDYEIEDFIKNINDVPFYIEYAKKCGGEVLELACGTGRVLIPLAKEEIKITGLDASREMLNVARKKIDALDRGTQRNIELVQEDMSRFDLHKTFSLIFCTFRSFQHLVTREERGKCLECVNRHLTKNGIFILHLFVPWHHLLAQERRSMYLGKFYDKENDVYVTRRSEVVFNLAQQTLHEDRFYEWTDKQGNFQRHVWSFDFAYLFRYEVELLLEKHGFRVEEVFGSFDKSPYNYYSGEQIFVARRE